MNTVVCFQHYQKHVMSKTTKSQNKIVDVLYEITLGTHNGLALIKLNNK